MKKDEVKEAPPHHHTGSIAAEDDELTLWLNKLWARSEPPERLEVWQTFGRNRATRGEMIHHEDFKPGQKLNIEEANKLANEILAAAQNDADVLRREASFEIAIIDRNRRATPLVRRIGPIHPKRTYAIAKNGDADNENDDDLDGKSIALRYAKMGLDQGQWVSSRNDRVVEGMLVLQNSIIENQQQFIDKLMSQNISNFEKLQESLDRSLDRELIRDREKLKSELWKDGIRTARNLLPGLFGAAGETPSALPPMSGNSTQPVHATPRWTPERTLVDNFLHDCEQSEGLSVALFGDYEDRNNDLVQTKVGIFSFEQLKILLKVRSGQHVVASLDQLMPDSGLPTAITEEQIQKAQKAGVTDGMGIALMELLALRRRAKENLVASQQATQQAQPTEESVHAH